MRVPSSLPQISGEEVSMRTGLNVTLMVMALWISGLGSPAPLVAETNHGQEGWKLYTNARFGFSVRYPGDWRLGDPMPDGVGITFYPPVEKSQVTLSGFMNLAGGSSQDGRQTLDEFADAHRSIITELYGKKHIVVTWQKDQDTSLAGFPAKRLTFTYQDDRRNAMMEQHIFSLGRNEGRGVRIKLPAAHHATMMTVITRMLESYEPGRDQNAVSPIAPYPKD
jgi:hypothetical protein